MAAQILEVRKYGDLFSNPRILHPMKMSPKVLTYKLK